MTIQLFSASGRFRKLRGSRHLQRFGRIQIALPGCASYQDGPQKGTAMTGNTKSSWGSVSRCLHWILGLAIIGMIAYGWWMNHFPARADRFFYRSIHADIGYLVLLLTVMRLIWRSVHPRPELPDTPRWQRIAARISHWALYLVTILVATLGWAHSGARPPNQNYASFFGWFSVPQFTSPDKVAAGAYEDRHIFFAYVLLALIVLHIAAAVWHHFVKRDRVAMRMIRGTAT
jgi:cytochrome b561